MREDYEFIIKLIEQLNKADKKDKEVIVNIINLIKKKELIRDETTLINDIKNSLTNKITEFDEKLKKMSMNLLKYFPL